MKALKGFLVMKGVREILGSEEKRPLVDEAMAVARAEGHMEAVKAVEEEIARL